MGKLLVAPIWVLLIAFIFQKGETETKPSIVCENYSINRVKKGYVFLLFLLPFLLVAFRTDFGDTGAYLLGFNSIRTDLPLSDFLSSRGKDELFYALEYFFKKFISQDAQFFLATVAFIESLLLLVTLRKYSEDFGTSIYIFVASTLMINWMCNGIRQFLVVTILFAMTNCILKNKWYIFIPVILLLGGVKPIFNMFHWGTPFWLFCGIHQSALIVIPIYFIVRGKALTKKVWILLLALLTITALGLLDSFLETTTENTMYAVDLELVSNFKGANPIRFIVSLIPVVLVIAKRKEIVTDSTPSLINLAVNMSFVTSTLYLASVFTSGTFVGRLPIYCELFNLILIPWLINHIYADDRKIVVPALYILYFVYFIYQVFVAWGSYRYTISLFGHSF